MSLLELNMVSAVDIDLKFQLIGSYSTDDGNCNENVTSKMSSHFFKLFLIYSNSLEMSKVGEFSWS